MSIRKRAAAAYRPRVGESVLDTRTGRTGIYMDTIGGEHYIRPPEGGCEWTARPEHVGPAGPTGPTGPTEDGGPGAADADPDRPARPTAPAGPGRPADPAPAGPARAA
ncbi:hypothetical protein ACIQ9P_20890 [Kitasatospora sp. NPDC094019]|uniref:hypothetical protein n=1 Tax=Kitasatospora sp. NPDC094019 TaxID=3364091 RepID=UPI0037F39893